MVPLLALVAGLTFVVYLTIIRDLRHFLTPTGIFAIAHLIMTLGTLAVIDERYETDRAYALIMTYSYCAFMAISGLSGLKFSGTTINNRFSRPAGRTVFWYFLSAAIVLAYMVAVGYSAFVLGVQSMATGGEVDVATLRLNSYSGDEYFAPGYVNQFKNSLFPALTVVVSLHLWTRGLFSKALAVGLTGFAVLGLLWTGQRSALFFFTVVVIVYSASRWDSRRSLRRSISIGIVALGLLLTSTVVLGRRALEGVQGSDRMLAALGALIERVALGNQTSGVVGFRYMDKHPLTAMGQDWLGALRGLLPGQSGSSLSSEVYAYLYGTDRGTAPPSLWGGVYYNFGLVGTIAFPILLALVYGAVSRYYVRRLHEWSTLERIGAAGLSVVLGTWVSGSPTYLFNWGGVVYAALLLAPFLFARGGGGEVMSGRHGGLMLSRRSYHP